MFRPKTILRFNQIENYILKSNKDNLIWLVKINL